MVSGMTNLAACLVGGQSFHSALAMRAACLNPVLEHHRVAWAKKILFVIDEASMLGPHLFGCADTQLKAIGDGSKLFGGSGVVICGDFGQLPPTGSA